MHSCLHQGVLPCRHAVIKWSSTCLRVLDATSHATRLTFLNMPVVKHPAQQSAREHNSLMGGRPNRFWPKPLACPPPARTSSRGGERQKVPHKHSKPVGGGACPCQPLQLLGAGLCLTHRPQHKAGRQHRHRRCHSHRQEQVACGACSLVTAGWYWMVVSRTGGDAWLGRAAQCRLRGEKRTAGEVEVKRKPTASQQQAHCMSSAGPTESSTC